MFLEPTGSPLIFSFILSLTTFANASLMLGVELVSLNSIKRSIDDYIITQVAEISNCLA